MRVSIFVGACAVCVATQLSAQSVALTTQSAITLRLTSATLAEAVDVVAREGGITIRFDESVPAEVRNRQLSPSPLSLVNAPLASVLEYLTSRNDLAFVIVDSTTVRIQIKSR